MDCNCVGCHNTEKAEHQPAREKAIQSTRDRDANAFYRAAPLKAKAEALVASQNANSAAANSSAAAAHNAHHDTPPPAPGSDITLTPPPPPPPSPSPDSVTVSLFPSTSVSPSCYSPPVSAEVAPFSLCSLIFALLLQLWGWCEAVRPQSRRLWQG